MGYLKVLVPNIGAILKSEISRLARRELRGETDHLRKQVAQHRSQIAALKRRVDILDKQIRARSHGLKSSQVADEDQSSAGLRFSANGLAKQRQRLGLSARAMGDLMGVSALSVYAWESGKTRPRPSQLPKIAEIRKLGKRAVVARLESAKSS